MFKTEHYQPRRSLGPLPRQPLVDPVMARRLGAGFLGAGVLAGSLSAMAVPAEAAIGGMTRRTASASDDCPRTRHLDTRASTGSRSTGSYAASGTPASTTARRAATDRLAYAGSAATATNASAVRSSATSATATATSSSGSLGNASRSSVAGADGLQPQTVAVLNELRAKFPQITDVGGVRPDSLPDHPSGHALDLMIPSPTSAQGKALGDEVAAHLRANAGRLGVDYVIWRQHIWSTSRAAEGWRTMSDRGSATANHLDHVHVTVK